MLIGYARTSTTDQKHGLQAQIDQLEALGCERVFREHVSSVASRPELESALNFVRAGDTLMVMKLDRLARSVRHMGEIVDQLKENDVYLRIQDLNIDTSNATGNLIFNLMTSIAEFERTLMLERQKIGIAKARADGRYKGRQPTARAKTDDVLRLLAAGLTKQKVADQLDISRASVYRILNDSLA